MNQKAARVWLKASLLLVCGMLLSGCATSSVFSPYPDQMSGIRAKLNASGYASSIKTLSKGADSTDHDLYNMELGRVQQLSGNYPASISTYTKVINSVQQQQLAAKIQMSNILAQTGSLMTNDNALPYRVKGYELIFLYNYQVLNYLAIGDVQDALVSIRRSDQQQQWYVQQHQYELQQAKEMADKKSWSLDPTQYGPSKATYLVAKNVTDPMQNGFAYYLSGLVYEATGDYNNAFISLQNAIAIQPNNSYLQTKLLEVLEERGGSPSQFQYYMKQFGLTKAPVIPQHSGQVVVIYEQGLVPPMTSASYPLNIQGASQIFTFPVYKATSSVAPVLSVSMQDNKALTALGQTQSVVNVEAIAAKNLTDEYPLIFIREALRVVTQTAVLTSSANNSNATEGNKLADALAATLYMSLMAGADLRSWLTLPNTVQIYQGYLPPASISLILATDGIKQIVPLTIQANKTIIVWVVNTDNNLQVKLINA
ncbi:MAG: hypothetical protein Q7V63_06600 [Gammaproteobacteria bacterium]|nr:hypothetical protein [Gammaproteobacteria bacterium]